MSLKRKLSAVGYPNPDVKSVDETEFRKIISWIEINIIKLNNSISSTIKNTTSEDWPNKFIIYKKELGCPVNISSREAELDWIISYGISIEYQKSRDVYNKHSVDNMKKSNVPNVVAENPLDKLDYSSREFVEGITNLSRILKIMPHPDPLVTLEACSKIVQKRLHQQALNKPKDYILKGTPYPYEQVDVGINTSDIILNKAAKLLRLLYIQDLRDLQTNANECIVAVQSITANPKTDTKLGKVGF